MGDTLAGVKIKDTYPALIKFTDSTEASNVLKQLSDGSGIDLPFFISIDEAKFSKKLTIQGDGINDILDIKNNAGTSYLKVDKNGLFTLTGKLEISGPTATYSTGTNSLTYLNLAYTLNTTGGTNNIYGIRVVPTFTAITGTTHTAVSIQGGSTSSHNLFEVKTAGGTGWWFRGDAVNQFNGTYQLESQSSGGVIYLKPGANGSLRISQSVGLVVGADVTPTARLHVRGDGTNPIGRFENSAGTSALLVNNDLSIATGGALIVGTDITGGYSSYTLGFSNPYVRINVASASGYGGFLVSNNGNITRTTGETATSTISGLFAAGVGSANYKAFNIIYTINNGGAQTGTSTGILLNATETALNGMAHNLLDLQVGASSRLRVSNAGNLTVGTSASITARLGVRGDGTNPIARFENSAGTAQLVSDALGAFAFAQTINADGGGITVGAGRMFVKPAGASNNARMFIGDTGASSLMGAYGNNVGIIVIGAPTQGSLGGATSMLVDFNHGYTSSGTGNYTHVQLTNTINHTGASGISRSLYINTTVTNAFDYRAIETLAGSTSAHKLLRLANAAGTKVFEVTAAQEIGFYGTTPIAKPTVNGPRNDAEQALNNLLTELANLGIITNSTTPS